MYLSVIRSDEQGRVRRKRIPKLGDDPVDVCELPLVHAIVQTELVRDGVDARVIRVDQSLAFLDAAHGVVDYSSHKREE